MERVEGILRERSADVAAGAGWALRRWEREQEFDRALIVWAARFAFVTAAALAERWGVSEQRMRARVRRLERCGWVRRQRGAPNEPVRVVVTEAGGSLVGLSVRTPRGGEPLGHELAVIKRVIAIERHFQATGARDAWVLSERDMRRDQQAAGERRWAVEFVRSHGRRGRRWPDYAVATGEGRTAVELEFSLKGTTRLREIVRGYLQSGLYEFVDFVALDRPEDAGLWRCLERVLEEERAAELAARLPGVPSVMPAVRVVPWRDPLPHVHAGVRPFPPLRGPQGSGTGVAA
jgi:DNA-binding MarR family transcriptional regulator